MFLQKLELIGFKSFAEKTTLEFNQEMTAIVGPNGSGKSNIADAIRWVLGEQSLKILRGKRAQDVIFAGSNKKTRLGFAEVNLYLNNTDGTAPIDYSQVVITRRIYRNGESEYLINKNQVRLQDILLMLARSNFGQRSFSIIGQGMIDHILASSPQERKEFFDEATGVRQYQIKREQSVNKLLRTEDNLKQAESLLNEIAPRLRSLTRQVRKLERRSETEQKLVDWQQRYFGQLWQELAKNLVQQRQQFGQLERQEKELTDKINGLQKQVEAYEQTTGRQQDFTEIQSQYQTLIDQKNSLLRQQAVLKGRRDLEYQKLGKQNLAYLNQQKEDLQNKLKNLQERLSEQKQGLEPAQEQLAEKSEQQEEVLAEFSQLEKQLEEARTKLEKAEVMPHSEIKDRIIKIKSLNQNLLEQLEKAQDLEALKKIKQEAKDIQAELEEFHKRLERSDSPEASQQVLNLQQRLNAFLKNRDTLVNEVNQLKVRVEISRGRAETLEKEARSSQEELEQIEKDIDKAKLAPEEKEKLEALLHQEEQELKEKLDLIEGELQTAEKKLKEFNQEQEVKQSKVSNLQKELRDYQSNLNQLLNQINAVKVEVAKLETRREDLDREVVDELADKFDRQKKYAKLEKSQEEAKEEILKLKNQLTLIGGIDQAVVNEHKEVKGRYDFLNNQVEDLQGAIVSLEKVIDELDATIKKQFNSTFQKINKRFTEYFQILFQGGRAKLILWEEKPKKKTKGEAKPVEEGMEVDEAVAAAEGEASASAEASADEDEEDKKKYKSKIIKVGIDIDACPPGKKLKGIRMLSGGERALTSIAMICAIISNNPSPFVVLDEVDAALDEANSIRFADIIDELAHKTQFIMITHNRATMHQAAVLYGVTMGEDGVSKLLSISLREAEERYSQE